MLKGLLSFVKKGVTIIGILILVILGIMICIATGWLIRWMIWLACFFIDFWYDWAIIDWIVDYMLMYSAIFIVGRIYKNR